MGKINVRIAIFELGHEKGHTIAYFIFLKKLHIKIRKL